MDGLGKGIAIAAASLAVAYIAVELKNPYVCWAFVPIAWMAQAMWERNSNNDD